MRVLFFGGVCNGYRAHGQGFDVRGSLKGMQRALS